VLVHPEARLVEAASGIVLDGPELRERVGSVAAEYARTAPRGLVLARTPIDVPAVLRYLGALAAGFPVALLDPATTALADLIDRFEPSLVAGLAAPGPVQSEPPAGYRHMVRPELGPVWRRERPSAALPPHPDLAVLLTTSGSTGNPRLVRLSRAAVLANARAIVTALGLDGAEVAPTSLPLFYVYGLSVLNSHLSCGATVVIEPGGLLERGFWETAERYRITSLAAVPYQFEMLRRLRFAPSRYPSLRSLTTSGGRLPPEAAAEFGTRMAEAGGGLYRMYGMTEAAPRIAVLPPARLQEKLASVGLAVPGGRLSIRPPGGDLETAETTETTGADATGEVVYRGPNVMMGYAETAADLARGDDLGGVLHTGDLGHFDDEGFLYLTGRTARIGKVFGIRLNLDDVERMIGDDVPVAAVCRDDKIVIWTEDAAACRTVPLDLAERLRVHHSGFEVRAVDRLPLLGNGKIDYRALERHR
jgi:acyl-CoA synthetase (AMP-forming)/AMP-acid ligase II